MNHGIKLFSFLLRAAATCPDRLNCVTDRSRGLWACQGHRRATHPILLPPAVTVSYKAQQAWLVTRVPPPVPSKWDRGRQQKSTRIAGYRSVHKSQSHYLDIETWRGSNTAWDEEPKIMKPLQAGLWKNMQFAALSSISAADWQLLMVSATTNTFCGFVACSLNASHWQWETISRPVDGD